MERRRFGFALRMCVYKMYAYWVLDEILLQLFMKWCGSSWSWKLEAELGRWFIGGSAEGKNDNIEYLLVAGSAC
jgi:hypothetical protein